MSKVIMIKKVLNSSVLLVEEDGIEKVVLGRGIGYGKKQGDSIENTNIDKIFLEKTIKTNYITELMEEIPFEFFQMTKEIIELAEIDLGKKLDNSLYLTLTDHIHFAVERVQKNQFFPNKLYWEIKNYYPTEFQVGEKSLKILNKKYAIELPEEEASNIAFHLINAQSSSESTKDGFEHAKMISSIVNVVKYSIESPIDTTSIHYTRFITHVRFFVERFFSNQLLHDENNELYSQLWTLYPYAMGTADKVQKYIKKVYHTSIPDDEIVYLGIHIHRLIRDSENNKSSY